MKYIIIATPMLIGAEIISMICLLIMMLFFFADIKKADERRKYR